MNGVIEYRDDDVLGEGFCPKCAYRLSDVTTDGRGYCEIHGWQFAEWQQWNDPPEIDSEKGET